MSLPKERIVAATANDLEHLLFGAGLAGEGHVSEEVPEPRKHSEPTEVEPPKADDEGSDDEASISDVSSIDDFVVDDDDDGTSAHKRKKMRSDREKEGDDIDLGGHQGSRELQECLDDVVAVFGDLSVLDLFAPIEMARDDHKYGEVPAEPEYDAPLQVEEEEGSQQSAKRQETLVVRSDPSIPAQPMIVGGSRALGGAVPVDLDDVRGTAFLGPISSNRRRDSRGDSDYPGHSGPGGIKPTAARSVVVIIHELYKEFSYEDAVRYLAGSKNVPDFLVRPSESVPGLLYGMIKLRNATESRDPASHDWIKTFRLVQERKVEASRSTGSQQAVSKVSYKLVDSRDEFPELDALRALYMERFFKMYNALRAHPRFRTEGNEQVKNLVRAKAMADSSQVSYFMCYTSGNRSLAGNALLIWCPGPAQVVEDLIEVTHRGYYYWSSGPFASIGQLLDWWKTGGYAQRRDLIAKYEEAKRAADGKVALMRGGPAAGAAGYSVTGSSNYPGSSSYGGSAGSAGYSGGSHGRVESRPSYRDSRSDYHRRDDRPSQYADSRSSQHDARSDYHSRSDSRTDRYSESERVSESQYPEPPRPGFARYAGQAHELHH